MSVVHQDFKQLFMTPKITILRTILCIFFVIAQCGICLSKEFKIGLLIPYKLVHDGDGNYFKGENFAAAITIAVQDINDNKNLLPGHNISFTWADTDCNELQTIRDQFKMVNHRVSAIIGPGCYCKTAARNAEAFNLPIISYVSKKFGI